MDAAKSLSDAANQNSCNENPTGAVTRNVFANDVRLIRNAGATSPCWWPRADVVTVYGPREAAVFPETDDLLLDSG